MTKKTILIGAIIILLTIIVVLRLGSYISYKESNQTVFVGQVGKKTYVDNLSNKEVNTTYVWAAFLRGAPAPFQLVSTYTTKRIEILDADFDMTKRCGIFHINTYTYFNIKQFENLRIQEPCP